ncbi:MAG: substrate-binding domain-containing protein [Prevotella sp.]|nr:substrate-binding domain-containing protein [Prevotella sp.]
MNASKFIGLTLILGLFLACGNKPKNSMSYDYDKAAAIFTADESFYPILDEELEVFMATAALDSIRPVYTNQEEAITKLMKNETWLAFATRSLSPKEIQNLKDRQFVPRVIPIAYDGLAIIVNNANPDSCISIKDFKRILSGEVSRWSDIYPQSRLGDIDVVFDNPKSSTVTWCVDSLLGGKPINSKNIGAVKKSAEVIDWVEKHENAIGIIGSNWLNDKRDTTNVTFNKNITVMRVSRLDSATVRNSWQPYQYYLYNGNYPLVRTIYALLNEPRSGVPSAFGHFCRLPKGQVIILRAGLLPVQANMNVRDVFVSQ